MTLEMEKAERLAEIYNAIGKALWHTQAFEDTLAHLIAIILDIPAQASLDEAEVALGNVRKGTLGKLLRRAREAVHVDDGFEPFLERFLEDRNWLAHRMWRMHHDTIFIENNYRALMLKLRGISREAQELNQLFSQMMFDWFENKNLNETDLEKLKAEFDQL